MCLCSLLWSQRLRFFSSNFVFVFPRSILFPCSLSRLSFVLHLSLFGVDGDNTLHTCACQCSSIPHCTTGPHNHQHSHFQCPVSEHAGLKEYALVCPGLQIIRNQLATSTKKTSAHSSIQEMQGIPHSCGSPLLARRLTALLYFFLHLSIN